MLVQTKKTGNRPVMTEKIVDWDVKYEHIQYRHVKVLKQSGVQDLDILYLSRDM